MKHTDEKSLLSLGERSGLPPELTFLLDRYPRDDWQAHANLGAMAQFWLKRHDMFRDLGQTLTSLVGDYREERADARKFANAFIPRLQFFLQELHGHHHIEDAHYFPVFAKAERRLKPGFDLLDSDHHVIHDALEANAEQANAFLSKLGSGRDAARFAADAYADNIDTLVPLLLRHLHDEEDLIIPLILDRTEHGLGVA